MTDPALGLFQGFGVEIEYMIVDRESLSVRPLADRLMERVGGEPASEVERGSLAWSNELVLHVLELKTNGPADRLDSLSGAFAASVRDANRALAPLDAILLPGGVHPWMDPGSETRLWPHEYNEVYRTFDRIFSCTGHGWANLQATHLNLPFRGEAEFRALHGAIRALLPLLPALAASSPILDGRITGALDQRMVEYRRNAKRVPSVAGRVIPEAVESTADYRERILEPIYRDLASLDPDGILRHEWVNARGAIARFDRGAIEIRILDVQECPAADLAIVRAVARVAEWICAGIMGGDERVLGLETSSLSDLLDRVVRDGDRAALAGWEGRDAYLSALDVSRSDSGTVRDVWAVLLERAPHGSWEGPAAESDAGGEDPLRVILDEGPLARRILARSGPDPVRNDLVDTYRELARCLEKNRVFRG